LRTDAELLVTPEVFPWWEDD